MIKRNTAIPRDASLKDIYMNWIAEKKIITTDIWSSELSKLVSNAFLAQTGFIY